MSESLILSKLLHERATLFKHETNAQILLILATKKITPTSTSSDVFLVNNYYSFAFRNTIVSINLDFKMESKENSYVILRTKLHPAETPIQGVLTRLEERKFLYNNKQEKTKLLDYIRDFVESIYDPNQDTVKNIFNMEE